MESLRQEARTLVTELCEEEGDQYVFEPESGKPFVVRGVLMDFAYLVDLGSIESDASQIVFICSLSQLRGYKPQGGVLRDDRALYEISSAEVSRLEHKVTMRLKDA